MDVLGSNYMLHKCWPSVLQFQSWVARPNLLYGCYKCFSAGPCVRNLFKLVLSIMVMFFLDHTYVVDVTQVGATILTTDICLIDTLRLQQLMQMFDDPCGYPFDYPRNRTTLDSNNLDNAVHMLLLTPPQAHMI